MINFKVYAPDQLIRGIYAHFLLLRDNNPIKLNRKTIIANYCLYAEIIELPVGFVINRLLTHGNLMNKPQTNTFNMIVVMQFLGNEVACKLILI